jgi:hypothetical protein
MPWVNLRDEQLTKNKQAICQSGASGTPLKALELKGKTGG